MKIAVNARCLLSESTNPVSRFTEGLLEYLPLKFPQHQFYYFADKPLPAKFTSRSNVTAVILKPSGSYPILLHWWFQLSLTKALRKINPEVFLSPDGLTNFKTKVPRVTFTPLTAQNAIPDFPKSFLQKYRERFVPKSAHFSEKVLVTSRADHDRAMTQFKIKEDKISIIFPAVNAVFKPIKPMQQVYIREKFTSNESYFLVTGFTEPSPGLHLLLEAFDLFKQRTGNDLKLVFITKLHQVKKRRKYLRSQVHYPADLLFPGKINAQTLADLYGAAVATFYLPGAADYGLPLLEAQSCHSPLITLATGAGTELAAESAWLIQENSAEEIFLALEKLYHYPEVRQEQIKRGNLNGQRFSWAQNAQQLMAVLQEVIKTNANAGTSV